MCVIFYRNSGGEQFEELIPWIENIIQTLLKFDFYICFYVKIL